MTGQSETTRPAERDARWLPPGVDGPSAIEVPAHGLWPPLVGPSPFPSVPASPQPDPPVVPAGGGGDERRDKHDGRRGGRWGMLGPRRAGSGGQAANHGEGRDATVGGLPDGDIGRVVGAAGWVPEAMSGVERREQLRAARRVEVTARRAVIAERKAALDAARAERNRTVLLPRNGERRRAGLRVYRRLRVRPSRATSDVLAFAYPFLAEGGLGSDGVLIGHDSWSGAAFVFDPWVLYDPGRPDRENRITNPNMLLAGVIGRGKSALAKSLTTRSLPLGRRVYVPGDPKGEWTPVVEACGGVSIQVGTGNRLNPLDEGPRPAGVDDSRWREIVALRRKNLLEAITEQLLGRPLRSVERTAVVAALEWVVEDTAASGEPPVLPMVVDAMFSPRRARRGATVGELVVEGREAAHALARLVDGDLAGMFDGPSTVSFDPSLPMMSVDLSHVEGGGASDMTMALVMTCASAWMEAALLDSDAGQRWVVYDEAWRIMRSPMLVNRMRAQWKMSRAYGIVNLAIIHRLSDLAAVGDADSETRNTALGLLADCSIRVIYAQESGEAAKTGDAIGLSGTETAQLPHLEQGEGLWRIGERAYMVRHRLTPGELSLFDTNTKMT